MFEHVPIESDINGLKDLYFVHIPKTAGTSLTMWMEDYYKNRHLPIYGHIQRGNLLKIFNTSIPHVSAKGCPIGTKYFTICRNPYTRLLSMFNFVMNLDIYDTKREKDVDSNKVPFPEKLKYGFNHYIRNIPVSEMNQFQLKRYVKHEVSTQKSFLCDQQPPVYILRYENLEEDFKQIQDYYDYYEPLPRTNVSKIKHATMDDYTPELADYVYETWKEDFEYFGYDKELPQV